MKVLLDTCVLSELRRSQGAARVRAAVTSYSDDDLFVSVLTIGELVKGIALLDPGRRKAGLEQWLGGLRRHFQSRILDLNAEIAGLWGEMSAAAQRRGRMLPAIDGLIATTAMHHGLPLMTRNVGDFAPAGVRIINPWHPPGVHDSA